MLYYSRRNRSAFSLIELLVVIALLSVLAALAAGTYFRVRSAQTVNATESSLTKINTNLDRNWAAVRDQADTEFQSGKLIGNASMDSLYGFVGGPNEKDRARAVWLFFRFKNEFPQTFAEALSPTTLTQTSPNRTIFSLPAKQSLITSITGLSNPTPAQLTSFLSSLPTFTVQDDIDKAINFQAAVILYLIVTQKGNRGEITDDSAMNGFTQEQPYPGTNKTYRVFVDAWGMPITYVRFMTNSEIQDQPYAKYPGGDFANPNAPQPPGKSNNPIDPTGTLKPSWNNSTSSPSSINFFNSFLTSANIAVPPPNAVNYLERYMRYNFMATAVSAGANKTWDGFNVQGSAILFHEPGLSFGNDNLYSYRLRKFGARSD